MSRSKRRGSAGRRNQRRSAALRRRSSALVLWIALALGVVATILWMREWRSPTARPAVSSAGSSVAVSDGNRIGSYAANSKASVGPVGHAPPSDPPIADAAAGVDSESMLRGDGVRLAIVIDDLGRSLSQVQRLDALGASITFAVLPFESKTPEVVQLLEKLDAETLLHLPMEAKGQQNPGPGALTLAMNDAEVAEATRRALERVGRVGGVNNHMGSAFSESQEGMQAVMRVIAEKGLFFLDSRTSPKTRGFSVARSLGVAAAKRTVFLDNEDTPEAIRTQFLRLLSEGRKSGVAIAIGHPRPNTMAVLEREVGPARALGFEFVPVSRLVER